MENENPNEQNFNTQEKDQETAINILKDAFPGIEEKMLNAILIASQGSIESAFDALLSITDSNYKPGPLKQISYNNADIPNDVQHQIENDFKYAYNLSQIGLQENENAKNTRYLYHNAKKERTFINDELPIIRENLKQGFDNAKAKMSVFFSNIKKRINEDILSNEKKNNFFEASALEFTESPRISLNGCDTDSFSFNDIEDLNLENNEVSQKIQPSLSFKDNLNLCSEKNK
ncbi:unnamed protein product [Pneumocystis jirovecii]|uniref:CUE domain-containing protein n=2 Tax=Pneumocystis jirovecii TaxID=42068 RepID=L0PFD3_PNEJI|nr:ubiquitin-binding protein CUE5 [Pneumocystis jirovecii RU7]KTW31964.1 hypothetical protein T551_00646 [Pneumocystis jirovecii RU7]CCJ30917.1 unnamed protein product [Pneumocystis jirovecii]